MTTEAKKGKVRDERESAGIIYDRSQLTDYDIHLFKEGNNFRIFDKFGSHLRTVDNATGTHFTVWAPNAEMVSVIGDFNG